MVRDILLLATSSIDSAKDSVGNGIGGSSGLELDTDSLVGGVGVAVAASSGCKSIDRPSSIDKDIRGMSSLPLYLSGRGGSGLGDNEARDGDVEPRVLTLNLEGKGWLLVDMKLSLFALSIILCLAVLSRIFFSVFGKYSGRWLVMSSLGGRCPKKCRSLEGRLAVALSAAGLRRPEDVGEGGSRARSGSCTPRLLRILIELARFVVLLVCGALRRGGLSELRKILVLRRKRPCSRIG